MSGESLYELTAEYREAFTVLADSDIDEQTVADTLEGLAGTVEVKALAVWRYAEHLDALHAGQKAAAARMAERSKRTAARAASLREYILRCMDLASLKAVSDDELELKKVACPESVVIDNEQTLNTKWKRQNATWTPDKVRIKEALHRGHLVDGARLERRYRLKAS